MYLQSINSVKHNAPKFINRSTLKKSRSCHALHVPVLLLQASAMLTVHYQSHLLPSFCTTRNCSVNRAVDSLLCWLQALDVLNVITRDNCCLGRQSFEDCYSWFFPSSFTGNCLLIDFFLLHLIVSFCICFQSDMSILLKFFSLKMDKNSIFGKRILVELEKVLLKKCVV